MTVLMNKKQEIKNRIDLINKGEVPAGYKNSWGYVYPEEWDLSTLNSLCSKVQKKNKDNAQLQVLTNSATKGVILQEEYFDREIVNNENTDGYYIVEAGDFMYNPRISAAAPAGPINRNNLGISGIASPLYSIFRAKQTTNTNFIERYFESSFWHGYMKRVSNQGARHDRLNLLDEDFYKMPIPQPKVEEQEKIAEILSCCDKVIELKEKTIEEKYKIKNLIIQNELKHINCNNDVSGKYIKLGTCVKFYKSKELPKEKIINNGVYPCIHYGQLFRVYGSQIKNIISYTNENDEYFMSQEGDVLMPTSDVTPTGLATASCINLDNVILGGDILIIRPNKKMLNGNYLSYVIASERKQILKLVTGVTVYHIYSSDMKNFKFWLPNIKKQENIVNKLSQCDKEIELLKQELEQYKQLKKSLSQLLLTGIVRVNEV